MRTVKEFSREQLMSMPLVAIRKLDIDTPNQQELVQEIVNIKLASLPVQRPIYRKDIPDIQSPAQELEWQEVINKREQRIRNAGRTDVVAEEDRPEPTPDPQGEFIRLGGNSGRERQFPSPATLNPSPPLQVKQGMAQPTGEGEPVNVTTGVSAKLTSKGKKNKVK